MKHVPSLAWLCATAVDNQPAKDQFMQTNQRDANTGYEVNGRSGLAQAAY